MVGILDALAECGLVRRTRSEADRRKHHITLTPKARKALPENRRTIRELNERALSAIPDSLRPKFPALLLAMKAEVERDLVESGKKASRQGRSPASSPSRSKGRAGNTG